MLDSEHRVVTIEAGDTHRLRRVVLRAGTRSTDVVFDGDDEPTTFHLGVRTDTGRLVGVSTWLRRRCPHVPDSPAVQLRGMATDPDHRGRGVASALLEAGRAHCAADGVEVVWARARQTAAGFYAERGFAPIGAPYTDATTGLEHIDMTLTIGVVPRG